MDPVKREAGPVWQGTRHLLRTFAPQELNAVIARPLKGFSVKMQENPLFQRKKGRNRTELTRLGPPVVDKPAGFTV